MLRWVEGSEPLLAVFTDVSMIARVIAEGAEAVSLPSESSRYKTPIPNPNPKLLECRSPEFFLQTE